MFLTIVFVTWNSTRNTDRTVLGGPPSRLLKSSLAKLCYAETEVAPHASNNEERSTMYSWPYQNLHPEHADADHKNIRRYMICIDHSSITEANRSSMP